MASVICPNCGESYHETTDAYDPTVTTTGNMLRLKKKYVLNGWTSFPEHEGMKHGDLWCPGCEGAYSSDGRVRIDTGQYAEDQNNKEMLVSLLHQKIENFQTSVIAPLRRRALELLQEGLEREAFPGTEYATAEIKEEKRKPGRPKRA